MCVCDCVCRVIHPMWCGFSFHLLRNNLSHLPSPEHIPPPAHFQPRDASAHRADQMTQPHAIRQSARVTEYIIHLRSYNYNFMHNLMIVTESICSTDTRAYNPEAYLSVSHFPIQPSTQVDHHSIVSDEFAILPDGPSIVSHRNRKL